MAGAAFNYFRLDLLAERGRLQGGRYCVEQGGHTYAASVMSLRISLRIHLLTACCNYTGGDWQGFRRPPYRDPLASAFAAVTSSSARRCRIANPNRLSCSDSHESPRVARSASACHSRFALLVPCLTGISHAAPWSDVKGDTYQAHKPSCCPLLVSLSAAGGSGVGSLCVSSSDLNCLFPSIYRRSR